MDRYARQTVLEEIGIQGQDKLSTARVLCVGAGGLGAPALLYLAAAGVGTLGIADFDTIDESNLQRQILYNTAQTGQGKAETAEERLRALNPHITINTHPEGLTLENAERLFTAYDIIIDGTDNFAAKFLINDAGVKFSKPVIYGALQRFEGQVSVFDATRGPCYRCLYPSPPKEQILNCAEAGVIGAVAGITGTTQAMQAIMLITGHDSFTPLIGKLWIVNAKTMHTRLLDIPKDPNCPVCSRARDAIDLAYEAPICALSKEDTEMTNICCADLKNLDNAILIDVREPDEHAAGHIPHSQNLPLSRLMQGKKAAIPQDCPVVLYCQKGKRSLQALDILQQAGVKNLVSLEGGYEAWCCHT